MLKRRSNVVPFGRRRRRDRLLTWWVLWRVPALLLIVMAAWWFGVRPVMEEQGWVRVDREFAICGASGAGAVGCVVDGDTLIIGYGNDRRRIRLTGYDAPELDGACNAESEAAILARDALHAWLGNGAFEWNGADAPPYDRYGRELRAVRRAGADGKREYLAETMIERGLAAESGWGTESKDWCMGQ
ncbi:MAG: hypothetical protein QNJ15_02160 [Erythrobacter sp.]|nr:hypothetical protein [Erythrobacter sp.]